MHLFIFVKFGQKTAYVGAGRRERARTLGAFTPARGSSKTDMLQDAAPSRWTSRRLGSSRARRVLGVALAGIVALTAGHANAGDAVHVVSKGQTLDAIARRYHVTVDALREANELRRGQHIHPGLSLVIPGKTPKAKPKQAATVPLKKSAKADVPPPKGAKPGSNSRGAAPRAPAHDESVPRAGKQNAKRLGWVRLTRDGETVELQLLTRHGRVVPAALPMLSRMLRHRTGQKTPIDPRLATLIGMVSSHFGGRAIHVVSGFRPYSPIQYTPHSNHNLGRAVDFRVEGIANTTTRDFCRTLQNAGVGYYPNSTFVHLDARAGKAYWVDYSKPGDAPKYDGPDGSEPSDDDASSAGDGSSDTQPAKPQAIDKRRITDTARE
jgi:uncharacterized protein YcbK (DUF882 family)